MKNTYPHSHATCNLHRNTGHCPLKYIFMIISLGRRAKDIARGRAPFIGPTGDRATGSSLLDKTLARSTKMLILQNFFASLVFCIIRIPKNAKWNDVSASFFRSLRR